MEGSGWPTFTLVGVSVRVALSLARLAPKQPPKVGPHFVFAPLLHGVALSALLDKSLLTLSDVSHDDLTREREEKHICSLSVCKRGLGVCECQCMGERESYGLRVLTSNLMELPLKVTKELTQ